MKVSAEGLENIPKDNNFCIYSNHQSNSDAELIYIALRRHPFFIVKKEMMRIPFLREWVLSMGCIAIDRKSLSKSHQAILQGVKQIKEQNRCAGVFPEGTRSWGPQMGPILKGSLQLATLSEAKILPVTINGSWKTFPGKRQAFPAKIKLVVHPPIETKNISKEEKKNLPLILEMAIKSGFRKENEGAINE